MGSFGSPTPSRFGNRPSVPTFPRTAGTWTSSDGAIIVPGGALESWYAYRATRGAARGEVIGFGDSTTYGSGGLYSYLSRLRLRSAAAGLADGGKGIIGGGEGISGSPILYDSPEVNGFVSTTFAGGADSYDNLDGQYWYDDGSTANHTLSLQFRGSCFRLWYSARVGAGDFTYSVDGGTAVTVKAYQASSPYGPTSRYVYVSGLTAGVTHTLTITNLALSTNGGPASGAGCWIALAPMNDTGLVWNKFATSGDTFNSRFFVSAVSPYTQSLYGMRYQTALGLTTTQVSSSAYTGAPVDTSYAAEARVKPVLAMANLGFNDLNNSASDTTALWSEYVKRFAGACTDAGVPGILISGQLPYHANWTTYGAARFTALKDQALASGLVFVDLFKPIGGPALSYAGPTGNPHLTKAEYETQGDYLWDGLLGLAA